MYSNTVDIRLINWNVFRGAERRKMILEYLREILRAHPIKLSLGTASICAVVGYLVLARRKRWVKVGKVGKLYIFPLKSGAVKESPTLYFQSMGPR